MPVLWVAPNFIYLFLWWFRVFEVLDMFLMSFCEGQCKWSINNNSNDNINNDNNNDSNWTGPMFFKFWKTSWWL